tara:strand:- start:621 stop:1016 length:396 start_codon:yes stop_codon:yes gene_type:complete
MSENIENNILQEEEEVINQEEEEVINQEEEEEYNPLSNIRYKTEFDPKTKNGKFKVDCWHTEKNGSLTPRDINKKSHKLCWFNCDVCAHDFKERITYIMHKNIWCPYCIGKKLCDDDDCDICYQNSFASAG